MSEFVEDDQLPSPEEAPPGRQTPMDVPEHHDVLDAALRGPYPDETEFALFGMGCFWGPEQLFWQRDGVYTTAVGYAGGHTPHPTYREVCTGRTGHAEVVRVVFWPDEVDYADLVRMFWENHDPTQGMRQGADVGTQYRSALYWYDDNQREIAASTLRAYQQRLEEAGYGTISTELREAPEFYFAEPKHQQYLAKHPRGYCGSSGTGVECPTDFEAP